MSPPEVDRPRCQDDTIVGPVGEHEVVSRVQSLAYERMIPLNVSLELTLTCNIRCLHCYNFDRDTEGPACGPGGPTDAPELSLEEISRVMGELRAAGTLFLSLTGGEVLSSPHLYPVLDRARELNLAVQMLSNGTLLRPGVAARLGSYRNLLGVSISMDELAIGFSLGLTRLPVVPVIVAIAVLALVASQLGLALGAAVGERFRERAEQVAALALIALGGYLIAERALA